MRATPASVFAPKTARAETWVRLWLAFIISMLFRFCGEENLPALCRAWLERALRGFAADIGLCILMRALAGVKAAPPIGAQRGPSLEGALFRKALGGAVRRALKAKGFANRAFALLRALKSIARLARLVRKRLRRGLSRLLAAPTRAQAHSRALAPGRTPARLALPLADTS